MTQVLPVGSKPVDHEEDCHAGKEIGQAHHAIYLYKEVGKGVLCVKGRTPRVGQVPDDRSNDVIKERVKKVDGADE